MSQEQQRIVEYIIILCFVLSPLWLIRPFRFETADREAHRQRRAGIFSARAVRKWYGWIVINDLKENE
jgi:hypothetical protein